MKQLDATNKREFWRDHIEQQKKSGESCIQYCRKNGLKKEQFHYYNSALNRKSKIAIKSDFIKIQRPSPSKSFSMKLPNGITIECLSNSKLLNEVLKIIIESN